VTQVESDLLLISQEIVKDNCRLAASDSNTSLVKALLQDLFENYDDCLVTGVYTENHVPIGETFKFISSRLIFFLFASKEMSNYISAMSQIMCWCLEQMVSWFLSLKQRKEPSVLHN